MNEGYTKVFVSLDGTEQQDFVLARAIKVAANNGAKLIIGHVIDSTALESAGAYPVDLVNGLEEAFNNSIAKQLEEAKANSDIPEVEVMIRAGRIRETLKDEMLDVVLVFNSSPLVDTLPAFADILEKARAAAFRRFRFRRKAGRSAFRAFRRNAAHAAGDASRRRASACADPGKRRLRRTDL